MATLTAKDVSIPTGNTPPNINPSFAPLLNSLSDRIKVIPLAIVMFSLAGFLSALANFLICKSLGYLLRPKYSVTPSALHSHLLVCIFTCSITASVVMFVVILIMNQYFSIPVPLIVNVTFTHPITSEGSSNPNLICSLLLSNGESILPY